MLRKRALYVSTAMIALTMGTGGALGQAEPAVAQAAPSTGLEEVIVTAEKRQENLQKAPLAVTALRSDALQTQRISEPTDLVDVVQKAKRRGSIVTTRPRGWPRSVRRSDP